MSILETGRRAKQRVNLKVNYFHFGQSLSDMASLVGHFGDRRTIAASTLENLVRKQRWTVSRCEELLDVLAFLNGSRGLRLSLPKLDRAVEQGRCWRERFQALHCRGFSFRFTTAARFRSVHIGPEINLRAALVTDFNLYYPPRVREALTRYPGNQHITDAIGWVLGQERQLEGQTWWYLINIQSDLTHHPVSCVRALFRGWQRVLFWMVLRLARQRGVIGVAIPPAASLPYCSERGASGGKHLDAWRPLYDGLASFFTLRRMRSDRPINVQPMRLLPDKWCSVFYGAEVDRLWNACATSLRFVDR